VSAFVTPEEPRFIFYDEDPPNFAPSPPPIARQSHIVSGQAAQPYGSIKVVSPTDDSVVSRSRRTSHDQSKSLTAGNSWGEGADTFRYCD
jgi:hypothetical protein